jgi:hypothetical protein
VQAYSQRTHLADVVVQHNSAQTDQAACDVLTNRLQLASCCGSLEKVQNVSRDAHPFEGTVAMATPCANGCGWTAFGRFPTCCTRCPHTHAADCTDKNCRVDLLAAADGGSNSIEVDADAQVAWEMQCQEFKSAAAAGTTDGAAAAAAEEADRTSLPMLAAELTEQLRDKRLTGIRLRYTVVNYDLVLDFLQKHDEYISRVDAAEASSTTTTTTTTAHTMNMTRGRAWAAGLTSGSRSMIATTPVLHPTACEPKPRAPARTRSATKILTVYHGTSKANFCKIIDGNLKVPDGTHVLHATDDGYYGKGIYTSPTTQTALAYARDGAVFVCLALPGRQFPAQFPRDKGKPCTPGFDSHFSPDASELVFFESSQLLPCFLVGPDNVDAATAAVAAARDFISSRTSTSDCSGASMQNFTDPHSHLHGVGPVFGAAATAYPDLSGLLGSFNGFPF